MKRTEHYLNEIARHSDMFYTLTDKEDCQLKQLFIDIYKDIKRVCDKYNLSIMLGAGTALGAVRHKGYIPWDDDFDMIMSHDELLKFIAVFEKELGDKYILSSPDDNNPDCKFLFAKIIKKGTKLITADDLNMLDIRGIGVDIYPIEKMPNQKLVRLMKCRLLDLIRILAISVSIYETKNTLFRQAFQSTFSDKIYYSIRWGLGMICSVFGRRRWYRLHSRLSNSSKGTKWCTISTCDLAIKELQPRDTFFPPQKGVFEGIEVLIPNNVDAYLKGLYGDYMTIPPVEQRERHFYVGKPDFGESLINTHVID